jgi:hypothetical protein
MNLEEIAPLIEENIKKALAERRYPFGVRTKPGLSNKIASSTLYNSVQVTQTNPETIDVSMADYWKFVQNGRLPGKKGVPLSAIEKWINDRKLLGRDKQGRFIKKKSFAFAIQKNIKKFGIPASNFLDVAIDNIMNDDRIIKLLEDSSFDDLIDNITGL